MKTQIKAKTNAKKNANATITPEAHALLAEIVSILDKVDASLADAPIYSPRDKSRSLKLPTGGEMVASALASLAQDHGIGIAGKPATDVTRAVERLASLTPVQRRLERTLRRVSDLVFDEQTRCWTDATMLYGVLREVGRRNPAVARDLEPIAAFFARGKKRGRKANATASAVATESPAAAPVSPSAKPAPVPAAVQPALPPAPLAPSAPQPGVALNGAGVSH